MRQQILEQINIALSMQNEIFIREQDIQLYLAYYFRKTNMFKNVFIEYHIPRELLSNYEWTDVNNIYIDIVLEKDNLFYPIEIKYKTEEQVLPLLIFGQNTKVKLKRQGANNIGCYDFWKDIKRLELLEQTFSNVERGIVLFVTNDIKYLKLPSSTNVGYAQFSINQGREIANNSYITWNGDLTISNNRPGFTLNHYYFINWTKMNMEKHHYLLV